MGTSQGVRVRNGRLRCVSKRRRPATLPGLSCGLIRTAIWRDKAHPRKIRFIPNQKTSLKSHLIFSNGCLEIQMRLADETEKSADFSIRSPNFVLRSPKISSHLQVRKSLRQRIRKFMCRGMQQQGAEPSVSLSSPYLVASLGVLGGIGALPIKRLPKL